jgi:hypothetical protein
MPKEGEWNDGMSELQNGIEKKRGNKQTKRPPICPHNSIVTVQYSTKYM